jgi:tetratricopeptide (TPR) repeat protein
MRYIILVLLCAINLSASAQWWRGDFKKHVRYPQIAQVKDHSLKKLLAARTPFYKPGKLSIVAIPPSQFNLEINERIVMRAAQHNMRFREYALASYRFSELAKIYVGENRLSEAKWYYLQSNLISKQQNDNPHTISNLICLAMLKADLGDLAQAQQDLAEARDLARSTGRIQDLKLIEEKIKYVQSNKVWLPKSELRYAEAVDTATKTK